MPIEVVAVGDAPVGEPGNALVAATREAMVNAAKFAPDAGEVAVYAELAPERSQVFVRDRGGGFDPGAVPEDRRGVRESIIGRMERSGGTARIRSARPAPRSSSRSSRGAGEHEAERRHRRRPRALSLGCPRGARGPRRDPWRRGLGRGGGAPHRRDEARRRPPRRPHARRRRGRGDPPGRRDRRRRSASSPSRSPTPPRT